MAEEFSFEGINFSGDTGNIRKNFQEIKNEDLFLVTEIINFKIFLLF